MSSTGRNWRRLLSHVQLQQKLHRSEIEVLEREISRLTDQKTQLLADQEMDSYKPLAEAFALRRLDRLQREVEAMSANRQARQVQLASADARLRVVGERLATFESLEARQSQERAVEDATALRVIEEQASPAQVNTRKT